MYFVRFTQHNTCSGNRISHKEFKHRFEAIKWLLDNGYEPYGKHRGKDPYACNDFWHPKNRIGVMGWDC